MAQIHTITVLDDINGQPEAEPRSFAFDGVEYEIDLTDSTHATFEKAMRKYIEKGRRVGHPRRNVTRTRTHIPKVTGSTAVVRDWARKNGYPDLAARGRIPKEIQDKFDAAHQPVSK